ncbi:hypothetical protein [Clostridium sp.]|uniref:hypothetical protein n=1 Tax=Clostridium sp. TaxID=1506 RepID=UPI00321695C2
MKKFFLILMLIIGLGTFGGCEKQTLTMPEYPLDSTTIDKALQEAELSWTIIGSEDAPFVGQTIEGQTVYTLNKNGEIVATISSAIKEGERYLQIGFSPYHNNEYSLPEEEWEKAIVFATLLYGGFDNTHQVYNEFTNDYDTKNTVKEPRERIMGGSLGHEEMSKWENEINGVNCQVILNKPYRSMPQEYLGSIRITSDVDTFK